MILSDDRTLNDLDSMDAVRIFKYGSRFTFCTRNRNCFRFKICKKRNSIICWESALPIFTTAVGLNCQQNEISGIQRKRVEKKIFDKQYLISMVIRFRTHYICSVSNLRYLPDFAYRNILKLPNINCVCLCVYEWVQCIGQSIRILWMWKMKRIKIKKLMHAIFIFRATHKSHI